MKKNNIKFEPHPLKVLIKCTKESFDNIFYKWIKRDDGSTVQLFTSIESDEGFDNRFTQNVSCGTIVAVGTGVENILPSDTVIIDYMVYNSTDELIGFINGDRLVALDAKTTYHTEDAPPSINMRKAYVEGDFDEISKILGVVRNDKLIAFHPYVFLNHKSNVIQMVSAGGFLIEETEAIVTIEVLSASPDSGYKDGDKVFIKDDDLFFRAIGGKTISVCFEKEILGKR